MAYLTNLVNLMILEDSTRSNLPTTRPQDTGIVRRLPVISKAFVNPMSERMKAEQETRVANLMTPEDHSWYTKLYNEYYDKISYDGGMLLSMVYVASHGYTVIDDVFFRWKDRQACTLLPKMEIWFISYYADEMKWRTLRIS